MPDTLRTALPPLMASTTAELPFPVQADMFGVGWTAAPPAAVHQLEFPGLATQLGSQCSFPTTCFALIAAALVSDALLSEPGRLAWFD